MLDTTEFHDKRLLHKQYPNTKISFRKHTPKNILKKPKRNSDLCINTLCGIQKQKKLENTRTKKLK